MGLCLKGGHVSHLQNLSSPRAEGRYFRVNTHCAKYLASSGVKLEVCGGMTTAPNVPEPPFKIRVVSVLTAFLSFLYRSDTLIHDGPTILLVMEWQTTQFFCCASANGAGKEAVAGVLIVGLFSVVGAIGVGVAVAAAGVEAVGGVVRLSLQATKLAHSNALISHDCMLRGRCNVILNPLFE